jgi:hypothetical protein
LEWICAGIVVVVFAGLVIADRDVVEAPWQSGRAIAVAVGGTIAAAIALGVMLQLRVPPVVRVLILGVPLVVASWWLISPFFVDTVVHEDFATSIEAARRATTTTSAPPAAAGPTQPGPTQPGPTQPAPTTAPPTPQLLGAGTFVGLAGHRGTGDAGVFQLPDGSQVLRLEHLDIDNGPDLQLYLVPGTDRRSPADGSHHFGALRGNIGEQTYDIPGSFPVGAGPWTVLVWCRAFAVEFVAATVTVA